MSDEPVFSYQSMKMSDEQFWEHMQHLDALAEDLPPEYGGFALRVQMNSGKTIQVPYVRFGKLIPNKKS